MPFYARYPSCLLQKGGAHVFSFSNLVLSPEHIKYLPQDYFPIVGAITRYPRYKGKRVVDPFVKSFIDESDIVLPDSWAMSPLNADGAYKSLGKYAKPILPMTDRQVKDMNMAWYYCVRHFAPYMYGARILEYEEAELKMDHSTSCGGLFNLHFSSKTEMFQQFPAIRTWFKSDWQALADDPNWTSFFLNSLKEEVRAQEKVLENNPRTFLAGSADLTVHGTRLFVDMNERMYASHLKSSSAVGMSPYKGNWDTLYRKLSIFDNGYALDESQYDSSLRPFMMWACAELRFRMYAEEYQTEENLRRVKTYYRNLIHSLVITPDGILVLKQTGNPSGSVNTISDNTLILYTLLAYAWIRTAPELYRNYEAFEGCTSKVLVGDDNTWTVADEAHDFFNARSVIAEWRLIGVTTTTDSLEPRHPRNLDFLSAYTYFLDGVAVPLYNREKLVTSLLFVKKKDIEPATTLTRTCALLTVGWTDPDFRGFCRRFIAWLLHKYDALHINSEAWRVAKSQIATDSAYYELFTGKRPLFLRPQSLSGASLKFVQPDKIRNSENMRTRDQGIKTRIQRGDYLLQKMVQNKQISPEGAAWFKAATNPFPDNPIEDLRGTPDYCVEPSVIRKVKQSLSITAPAGLAPGAEWSFQVVVWPWLNKISMSPTSSRYNNIAIPHSAIDVDRGGIEVFTLPTGSPSRTGTYFDVNEAAAYRIELDTDYTKGLSRLIGLGYEIVDDTADIYKQGHSYHYRQSNELDKGSNWVVCPVGVAPTNMTLVPMRPIMGTPEDAMLLPDTEEWAAEEGVYSVVSFNSINPPHYVDYTLPVIRRNYDVTKTDDIETYISASGVSNTANEEQVVVPYSRGINNGGTLTPGGVPAIKLESINQSCSMFTGLNQVAAYTLTVHYYYESFPSIAEKGILCLAQASAPYDALALEMYSHCMPRLPVAVPVGLNPNGEWWAAVVEAGAGALNVISTALGFPEVVPFISGGSSMVAKSLRENAKKKTQQPKQVTGPRPMIMAPRPPPQQAKKPQQKKKVAAQARLKKK